MPGMPHSFVKKNNTMASLQNILPGVATVAAGLMAGLFYAYSCSVNPGLHRLSDAGYLAAMQAINRAILNPVFLSVFLGTALLLPAATWASYGTGTNARFWFMLAASVCYVVGTLGVTMGGNVPLNEALDAFSPDHATAGQLAEQRNRFEIPWNRLHGIRTVASVLAFGLAVAGCLSDKE